MAETPSSGCIASARGLARLASAMANKGKFDGQEILSSEAWEQLHADPELAVDHFFGGRTNYTAGGLQKFGLEGI